MTTQSLPRNVSSKSFKETLAPLGAIWDVVARRIRRLALTAAERAFLSELQTASAQVARHILDAEDRDDLESALDAVVDVEELWQARDLILTHILTGRGLYGSQEAEDDLEGEGFAAFLEDVLGSGMRAQSVRIGRCFAASVVLQNIAIQHIQDASGALGSPSSETSTAEGCTASVLDWAFKPSVPRSIRRGVVGAIQADALLLSLFHVVFERKRHPSGVVLKLEPWLARAMADALVVRAEQVLSFQTTFALVLAQRDGLALDLPADFPIAVPSLQEIEAQDQAHRRGALAMFEAAKNGDKAPFGPPLLND